MALERRWIAPLAALCLVLGAVIPSAAGASVQFTKQWAGSPELDQPIGMTVDSDGNSYIADANNNRIEEVDSDGALVRMWGSSGTAEGQFNGPVGVGLDGSGNVYVADLSNFRIQEFSPTGTFIRMWGWGVDDGSSAYQTCTSGCQAGIQGSGDGQFNLPRDVDFDSAGNMYVVDSNNDRIQEFDNTSSRGFLTKWGTSGAGIGQFNAPFALAIDSADHIFVADTGNNRIEVFEVPGAYLAVVGAPGTGEYQFAGPRGVAVDSADNVYVADSLNNRIQKYQFTPSGPTFTFTSMWGWGVADGFANDEICTSNCHAGIAGNAGGQYNLPIGMALDSANNVFVADTNNNRVQVSDSGGGFVPMNRFGASGSDGQLDGPSGLDSNSSGDVYATAFQNDLFMKFDSTGGLLQKLGGPAADPSLQFNGPAGVAVDASGDIYIADSLKRRIVKYDSAGGFVLMWGKGVDQTTGGNVCTAASADVCGSGDGGSGPSEFVDPFDVAVDSSGDVYVADQGNDRIQKFDSSGNFISQLGGTGTGSGQLTAPNGVALDSSDNVYVADGGNQRVDKFDASGSFVAMWGKGVDQTTGGDICTAASGDVCGDGSTGSADGQFNGPNHISVDAFDNVYVADCSRDDVQVLRPTGAFVKKWGSSGSGDGQFSCPSDVAVHGASLYVSDLNNDRIEKFTETDTTAPTTSIDGGPSDPTNDSTPGFTFSSPSDPGNAIFECRIDSSSQNAYEACTSPYTSAPLGDGDHTLDVRAIDSAGNPDATPATFDFTVDTVAPGTTITSGPTGITRDSTPTFAFTSTETGSTFKCKVDSHPFAQCNSPRTLASLADGLHNFYVKATDPAGNSDATPAHRGIKIDTHAPSSKASAPTSTQRSAFNVTYTAADPSPATGLSRVELWAHKPGQTGYSKVAVDLSPNRTRAFSYRPAAGAGTYRFYTRARDKAGNYEARPATADATTAYRP